MLKKVGQIAGLFQFFLSSFIFERINRLGKDYNSWATWAVSDNNTGVYYETWTVYADPSKENLHEKQKVKLRIVRFQVTTPRCISILMIVRVLLFED